MEKMWYKEALFAGAGGNGFKLGLVLSLGWFWPRSNGCYVLFRGKSLEQIDSGNVLAAVNPGSDQISLKERESYEAGSAYFYVLRSVDNLGRMEHTFKSVVKLSIDGQGKLSAGVCNSAVCLSGEQSGQDEVRLLWYYCPIGQQAVPKCFNVYTDNGGGVVDYDNPSASVEYAGSGFYSYTGKGYLTGEYLFSVRVGDESGNENVCWDELKVQVTDERPEGVEVFSVGTE